MAVTKKIGLKEVAIEAKPILECFAGLILGNLAINTANKLLKNDPADTTKSLKKLAPPIVVGAGATAGVIFVKDPMLKNVLKGAALAGLYKTTKTILPATSFLNGVGLGLTPVSAVANTERWLYQEQTPVSGFGFPDLGDVEAPEAGNGYYVDAPAYFNGAEEQYSVSENQLTKTPESGEQTFGDIEIL